MKSGVAFGMNKGFITQEVTGKRVRSLPSRKKGVLGKRVSLIRNIVREVAGFAPYEKRILELLRTGQAKDFKKAYKQAKARLGTHKRGQAKRLELEEVLKAQKKKENK